MTSLSPDDPIGAAKGVGRVFEKKLQAAGILTVEDLLLLFPFRYLDMSDVRPVIEAKVGSQITVRGLISAKSFRRIPKRRVSVLDVTVQDGSGSLHAVFFNQPYLAQQLLKGATVVVHGKTRKRGAGRGLEMANPRFTLLPEDGAQIARGDEVVPIYRKTRGIPTGRIRRIIRTILESPDFVSGEFLAAETLSRCGLPGRREAFRSLHLPVPEAPGSRASAGQQARRRLVFEEFLLAELVSHVRRNQRRARACLPSYDLRASWDRHELPFALTRAQRRVLETLGLEMKSGQPMNRFLQGDVGAGKTIVAILAMLAVADGGGQAALMAPTELLAEQHYESLISLFPNRCDDTVLLTGSLPPAQKKLARSRISTGEAAIIVGTHALSEGASSFARLHLVVIDEQQRFGVRQRTRLVAKGVEPHFLVMTATPIPRSLALVLSGALDFSILDEIPPGRGRVRTYARRQKDRERILDFIVNQVRAGGQAYLVHPAIQEPASAQGAHRSVQAALEELKARFPDVRTGALHGQLDGEERQVIMRRFAKGEVDILLCTSVVEVGLHNPRANIMCIQNAESFGLSQLHQLRGRIGRGSREGICILIAGAECSTEGWERLVCLEKTTDGFEVADKDLLMRGPGQLGGFRQSGFDAFKVADIHEDYLTLLEAKREAGRLLDKGLANYPLLSEKLDRVLRSGPGPEPSA